MEGIGTAQSFRNLGIAPGILSVLDKLSYTTPTPIQQKAIAPAVTGKDIVGIAQTGTGKTLAFSIPVIQRLLSGDGRSLILVPTRELALQVHETLDKVGRPLGIHAAVLIGGLSMGPQVSALRRNPRAIIATPGRLLDHMEQRTIRLDTMTILVLDEADRMLDMGFLPQIKRILAAVPHERQTMLFSATLSAEILSIATTTMKLPLQIEVAPPGTTAEAITQELFIVKRDDKLRLLEKVLGDYRGSTLVFARTKHGASKVARKIEGMGHSAAEIHSNRSLNQRKAALQGFKTGRYRVLVATDIMARGIDVKDIELVINFDLPSQSSDYVHRIGRTARAGREGRAISFVLPEERKDIRDIERLIRKPIQFTPLPELPAPSEKTSMHSRARSERPRDHASAARSHAAHSFRRQHGSGSRRGQRGAHRRHFGGNRGSRFERNRRG